MSSDFKLDADFKYLIEQKSYGVEMVRLFAQMDPSLTINLDIETFRVHIELTWNQPGPDLDPTWT